MGGWTPQSGRLEARSVAAGGGAIADACFADESGFVAARAARLEEGAGGVIRPYDFARGGLFRS